MASPKADLMVVVQRKDGTVERHHVMAKMVQPQPPPPKEG